MKQPNRPHANLILAALKSIDRSREIIVRITAARNDLDNDPNVLDAIQRCAEEIIAALVDA